jgi:hypothetical protein
LLSPASGSLHTSQGEEIVSGAKLAQLELTEMAWFFPLSLISASQPRPYRILFPRKAPRTPVAGLAIVEPAAKLPAMKWTLFGLTVLLSLGMSPGLAETVLLRCVTSNVNHLKPKRSWVVVDWARGEIKTENFSTDKPPKWMIFQIEEMNEAIMKD